MYHVPVPGQLHRGSACRVLLHQKETGINTKQLYWSCARRNYNYIGHICHLYTPTCVTCLIVKADDARWNPINIRQNSVQAYADYQRRVNMFFPGPRREWCISRCKYGQINIRHLCICCESELRAHIKLDRIEQRQKWWQENGCFWCPSWFPCYSSQPYPPWTSTSFHIMGLLIVLPTIL